MNSRKRNESHSGDEDEALLTQAQALRSSLLKGRQQFQSRSHDLYQGRLRKTSSSDEELTRLVKEYRSTLAGLPESNREPRRLPSLAKPVRQHTRGSEDSFDIGLPRHTSVAQVPQH